MRPENQSIFRGEALRHYLHGRERDVLPRYLRPRTFLILWLLVGLLAAAGVLAWATRVPTYTSGTAIVTATDGIVVLVPEESAGTLRAGQAVWVRWPGRRDPVRTQLTEVRALRSAAALRERFALSAADVPGAAVVAVAEAHGALPAGEEREGSVGSADVEVGARRVLALVPVVGEMFR